MFAIEQVDPNAIKIELVLGQDPGYPDSRGRHLAQFEIVLPECEHNRLFQECGILENSTQTQDFCRRRPSSKTIRPSISGGLRWHEDGFQPAHQPG